MSGLADKDNNQEFEGQLTNVAKQSGISFIGRFFKLFVNLLSGIFLARLLGPVLLGRFRLGTTLVNLTTNLTKIGFDRGLIKYIPIYKLRNEKSKLKSLILFSFFISFLVAIVISAFILLKTNFIAQTFFHDKGMKIVLKYSAIYLLIFTFFRLTGAVLKGSKRVDIFTYINNIFVPLIYLIIIVLSYKVSNKLLGIYIGRMFSQLVGGLIAIFYFYKYIFPEMKNINLEKFDLKSYFSFSLPLLFIGLLYFLISNVDKLMLGYFATSSEVGIYSVAFKIAILTIFPLRAVNSIFNSIVSELVEKDDYNSLERLLKTFTKWGVVFGLNFLGLILVLNKEILMIFGNEYLIGKYVLIFLTAAQFINLAVGPTGTVLIMSGNQIFETCNSILVLIINVIMNLILIPQYGALGAAMATGLAIIIVNIFKLGEVYWKFKMHPYNLSYYKVIIGFIVSSISIFFFSFLDIMYILKIIISGFIIVMVNGFILYFLRLEEEDIFIINKFKNKFL